MSTDESPHVASDHDLVFSDWNAVTERVMAMMNAHLPIAHGTLWTPPAAPAWPPTRPCAWAGT